MTSTVYHAEAEHLSSTMLKKFKVSPKHFKLSKEKITAQSEAMRFGTIFHDYCENGNFEKYTLFNPPINSATGKPFGSDTKKFNDALGDVQNPVTFEQQAQIKSMYESLTANKLVEQSFRYALKEHSFFCEYEGLKLKIRPDGYTTDLRVNLMYDVKTCADIQMFEKDILKYNYHISAAMYVLIYEFLTGEKLDFFWFVVEKSEPYNSMVFKLSDSMFIAGAKEFNTLLNLAKKCIEKNEYPGMEIWNENPLYKEVEIPAYYNFDYNFYNF